MSTKRPKVLEISSDELGFENEFVSEGRSVIVPPSNVEGRETEEDPEKKIE